MGQQVAIIERTESVDGGSVTRRVLIPTVDILSEKIRQVPAGTVRDLDEVLAELAREHGADMTCPTTTQRVLKVIAVIAHSAVTLKDDAAVPFWRVIDPERDADRLAGGRGFAIAQQTRERRA